MVALAGIPPGDAILPRVLREDSVWQQAWRDDLSQSARNHRPGATLLGQTMGLNFGTLLNEIHRFAEAEHAPSINEFHIAEALVKLGGDGLTRTGVDGAVLVKRVAQLLGRVESSADEKAKVWCICDTTFFQESRAPFDEIDWPHALGVSSVVLVIAPVVVRELDEQKSDPRGHRSRQRDRARQVLRRLDPIIDTRVGDRPAAVRPKVEVLLLDWEPQTMPEGLDAQVNDDRIVASAVEFRWSHPGLRVAILSDDRGPRIKAGRFNLERIALPELERRKDPSAQTELT